MILSLNVLGTKRILIISLVGFPLVTRDDDDDGIVRFIRHIVALVVGCGGSLSCLRRVAITGRLGLAQMMGGNIVNAYRLLAVESNGQEHNAGYRDHENAFEDIA